MLREVINAEGSNKWGGITYIRYQAVEPHYLGDELVAALT